MKKTLSILAVAAVMVACNRTEDIYEPKGDYENGFLVLNEGGFGKNNGSLTYTNYDFSKTEQETYQKVNKEVLGDTSQSAFRYGDDLYIVMNGSNKLIKVNRYTLKKEGEVTTNLSNPRYATVSNGKLFVTNWGSGSDNTDDYILVLDPETLKELGKISVDFGVERIFNFQNKVYALLQGGWGKNNKVAVINPASQSVEKYYTVGKQPNGFAVENDRVLITCSGDGTYDTNWNYTQTVDGSIWTLTGSGVEKTYDWVSTTDKKESIREIVRVNQSYFFLVDGKLHKAPVGSDLTKSKKVDDTSFYHIGKLGNLFAVGLDAKDYVSKGEAVFFNENGEVAHKTNTGIIPNSIVD